MTIAEKIVKPSAAIATRATAFMGYLVRRNHGEAVALNLKAMAFTLRCTENYLQKMTMRIRTRAWSFQGYGIYLFIRYKPHRRSSCGIPQLYAISRHNDVWGDAPRVRWHLRKRSIEHWEDYRSKLKNLAFSMIFRKSNRGDGTDKGLKPQMEDRKLRRQTANRPRWRVFLGLAGSLAADHAKIDPAAGMDLRGWAARRLSEGHNYDRVLECLAHAVKTLARYMRGPTPWLPVNHRSFICGIAREHLEMDGLTPYIRWREKGRQRKRHGEAFKVKRQEGLRDLAEWDRGRESLRERKKLPDGTEIEYDPKLGRWIDL